MVNQMDRNGSHKTAPESEVAVLLGTTEDSQKKSLENVLEPRSDGICSMRNPMIQGGGYSLGLWFPFHFRQDYDTSTISAFLLHPDPLHLRA